MATASRGPERPMVTTSGPAGKPNGSARRPRGDASNRRRSALGRDRANTDWAALLPRCMPGTPQMSYVHRRHAGMLLVPQLPHGEELVCGVAPGPDHYSEHAFELTPREDNRSRRRGSSSTGTAHARRTLNGLGRPATWPPVESGPATECGGRSNGDFVRGPERRGWAPKR
jgi:hypothetical protein